MLTWNNRVLFYIEVFRIKEEKRIRESELELETVVHVFVGLVYCEIPIILFDTRIWKSELGNISKVRNFKQWSMFQRFMTNTWTTTWSLNSVFKRSGAVLVTTMTSHTTTSRAWGKWLTSYKLHGWGGWVVAPWTWLSGDSVQSPCMKSTHIYNII